MGLRCRCLLHGSVLIADHLLEVLELAHCLTLALVNGLRVLILLAIRLFDPVSAGKLPCAYDLFVVHLRAIHLDKEIAHLHADDTLHRRRGLCAHACNDIARMANNEHVAEDKLRAPSLRHHRRGVVRRVQVVHKRHVQARNALGHGSELRSLATLWRFTCKGEETLVLI